MGIFSMGSSENNLQTSQQNSIANTMTFFFGDENKSEQTADDNQSLTPVQYHKDEATASVGVGVGGGSGSGGTIQQGGDDLAGLLPKAQTSSTQTAKDTYTKYGLIIVAFSLFIILFYKAFKKKKKPKPKPKGK